MPDEIEKLREALLKQIEKLPEDQASDVREKIESASPEELQEFIKSMQAQQPQGCLFCQIVEGKVETISVYEDEDILAILDIYPASLGHLIVLTREHYHFIQEIPDKILEKF